MKLRYILISVLIIAVLIVGAIFIFPKLTGNTTSNNTSGTSTTNTTNSTGTTPTQNSAQTSTNQPSATATTTVTVPQEMKTVIEENKTEVFVDTSNQLATDYPSQMIPLYGVLTVGDSYQITNGAGDPGWTTSYVSNLSTNEIIAFYRPLLEKQSDFSEETAAQSTYLDATASGYTISITVSPNNQQKTDLEGNSAVTIFIEQN
ncbi:hypothetical protein GH808_09540 [Acetobacterium fimetarium]|uniref:Uncharacterized protein n=1 Tax=Acetobacterium fimetarium TaxID=52691 RepID=A0ABR6WW10_9FIRM|nr:hypothetical protein [Acetobacterium fimetarium]MBC3804671.1 hypothetical protein [Acetobacterium fimetarium]